MSLRPLRPWRCALALASAAMLPATAAWSQNRIDTIRADAPELAAYGAQTVGVRTIRLVNPGQTDLLKIDPKAPPAELPRSDRALTVEVWYPAVAGSTGNTVLKALIRDGKTEVALHGRAVRDAVPADVATGAPAWPLVVMSHGFPGNRFLMSPLAENIASKGYVVASIDHADSTYDAIGARSFASTLVNRPLDQWFVIEAMARAAKDPASFLRGRVDADRTAVIGYSMGGYGAMIVAGAGLSARVATGTVAPIVAPAGTLAQHQAGSATHRAHLDPRVKTVIGFAPWGGARGAFDADSLAGVRMPLLLVAGSLDDVSGYDDGVRAIWRGAVNSDRALLTFDNANHNAGAPMPAPAEANRVDPATGNNYANHYIDAVWDNARMNNVAQHFVTAWLGRHLKADASMAAYLQLVPEANRGVWAMEANGQPKPEHTHWKGFPARTAKGLRYEVLPAGSTGR